jgi:hypothetical protein
MLSRLLLGQLTVAVSITIEVSSPLGHAWETASRGLHAEAAQCMQPFNHSPFVELRQASKLNSVGAVHSLALCDTSAYICRKCLEFCSPAGHLAVIALAMQQAHTMHACCAYDNVPWGGSCVLEFMAYVSYDSLAVVHVCVPAMFLAAELWTACLFVLK